MRYKDRNFSGEYPEYGAIFMANSGTKKECFDRKLFGLPSTYTDFVLDVKKGMTLFLFEFGKKVLYGVFRAASDGDINIVPGAYRSSQKTFPAQVRFTTVWDCIPLAEHEFQDVIKDNYYSGKKFNFGLNKYQVDKLMMLFRAKKLSTSPERHVLRYRDKSAESDRRFGDLRKTIRDRLRIGNEEKYHKHSNEKIAEDDRLGYDSDRDSSYRVRYKNTYMRGSNELDDGNAMNWNFRKSREITKKDRFPMMEKIEAEDDLKDDYIPINTEPHEEHFSEIHANDAKILIDDSQNKDLLDYYRLREEYIAKKDFSQSLTRNYLGSSGDVGSRRVSDEYLFGFDAIPRTSSEPVLTNDVFYPASCDPTIPCIPVSFNSQPNFIPLDNRPFYQHSEEISISYPESKSPSYHLDTEGSVRYFDDTNIVEGNQELETVSQVGLRNPMFPEFISLGSTEVDESLTEGRKSNALKSSMIPFSAYDDSHQGDYVNKVTGPSRASKRLSSEPEEDSVYDDKLFCQTRDKRVSVFSRLTSDQRRERGLERDEKHELNASVDKTMEMLKKVLSVPKLNIKSVINHDDDDITLPGKVVDDELCDNMMEIGDDQEEKPIQDELVLDETRLLDYKRRRKANNEHTNCLAGDTSELDSKQSFKRRKLVRPAFVGNELATDSVGASKTTDTLCENTPEDNRCITEVDEGIKSVGVMTTLHEDLPSNADTSIKPLEIIPTLPEDLPSNADTSIKPLHEDGNISAECHKSVNEGEECSQGEGDGNAKDRRYEKLDGSSTLTQRPAECQKTDGEGAGRSQVEDGNAGIRLVSDVFVELTRESSLKDDQKMCGWIDW